MDLFQDKKILLIAPNFHGLQNKIHNELLSLGAEVDYYDERPSNNFITKVLLRLKFKVFTRLQIKNYYENILNTTKNSRYDFIFIINLEAMTESILKQFRIQNDKSEFLLYMWDSLELKTVSNDMLNLFDRTYTFDPRDARKRDMTFLDLFYTQEYINFKYKEEILYDLCFIGTIHGDRYKILKEIRKQADEFNMSVKYYLFMPSKIMFWMRKLFDKSFHGIKYTDVKFKSLDSENIIKIMNQSKAVIDLSYKNQKGLSMRTFEVLGAHKKLLTTHEEVRKYDFYNSNNISIISKECVELNIDFFQSEYIKLDNEIYEKYILKSWLEFIFGNKKD